MNALKGEAEALIGNLKVKLSMNMQDLANISRAVGTTTLPELYQRLVGVEPFTALVALRICAKAASRADDEEAKPIKKDQVGKTVAETFTLADQDEVQAAFSAMLIVLTKKPGQKSDEDEEGNAQGVSST